MPNRYPARGGYRTTALSNYRAVEDDRTRAEAHKKRGPMQHELKTDPDAFEAVYKGLKTHEIRNNDRWFKEGDTLLLRETRYSGEQMRRDGKLLEYTGRELTRRVSHIQSGYGLQACWVVLSFATEDADLPMGSVLALFRANCVNYSGNYEVTPGQAQRIASELRKLPAAE